MLFFGKRILNAYSPRRQFLPFEQARDWARSLGLRGQKEWEGLRGRPTYIPSNPERIYENQYIGIHDWLGYQKVSRRAPRKSAGAEISHVLFQNPKKAMNAVGWDHLQKVAPGFEFVAMPRDARVPTIFRPLGSSEMWCALRIRTSGQSLRGGRATSFTHIDRSESAVLCIDLLNTEYFLFPHDRESVGPTSIFVTYAGVAHKRFHVPNDDIPNVLASIFAAGPVRSVDEWMATVAGAGRGSSTCVNISALSWLTSTLWNPAGISVEYPCLQLSRHNIVLNGGHRCLHRVGCPRQKGRTAQLIHVSKRHEHEWYPYDEADGIDFVIVSPESPLRGGTPSGCFIFPLDVLVENDIFSREGVGGVLQTGVYPPYGPIPRDRRVQRVVDWQHRYWIDLGGDVESCARARQKFCDILGGSGK